MIRTPRKILLPPTTVVVINTQESACGIIILPHAEVSETALYVVFFADMTEAVARDGSRAFPKSMALEFLSLCIFLQPNNH